MRARLDVLPLTAHHVSNLREPEESVNLVRRRAIFDKSRVEGLG
jgi:hypothetical protein